MSPSKSAPQSSEEIQGLPDPSTAPRDPHHPSALNRRRALAAGLVGATSLTGAAAVLGGGGDHESESDSDMTSEHDRQMPTDSNERLPTVFLPHGGGPWPFVEVRLGSREEQNHLASYLRGVQRVPKTKPRALLVVSAHWEEPVPTVMTSTAPPMLYDYYGFPEASYELEWPAPGEPKLAARVRALLEGSGFTTAEDPTRGFDHGTFVPLMLTYPDADVPTVQLSLRRGLDPAEHLRMGQALSPLRDEGVFIIGSGMTYHNLRAFHPSARPASEAFDSWLRAAATAPRTERDEKLTDWQSAPSARAVHPREEHLLPLMVVAGAAGDDLGKVTYDGSLLGLRLSGYQFG